MKKRMIYFTFIICTSLIFAPCNYIQAKNKIPFQRHLQISRMLIEESGDSETVFPLQHPTSIVCDSKGNVYLYDYMNCGIAKYNLKGKYLLHWGKKGTGPGELDGDFNSCLYIDHSDKIYIPNQNNSTVNIFSSEGKLLKCFRTEKRVVSITVDKKNNIYCACSNSQKNDKLIYIYSPGGKKILEFGEPYLKDNGYMWNNSSIVKDDDGSLYQVFEFFPVIRKYNSNNKLIFEKRIFFPARFPYFTSNKYDRNHLPIDESEARTVFSKKICCSKKSIFIDSGNLIQIDKEGCLIGIYLIPSSPNGTIFPDDLILYPHTKEILRVINGDELNGAAFYKIDSLE